jgi:hypothetical protein
VPVAQRTEEFVATFVRPFVATFVGAFVALFVLPIPNRDFDKVGDKVGDKGPESQLSPLPRIVKSPWTLMSRRLPVPPVTVMVPVASQVMAPKCVAWPVHPVSEKSNGDEDPVTTTAPLSSAWNGLTHGLQSISGPAKARPAPPRAKPRTMVGTNLFILPFILLFLSFSEARPLKLLLFVRATVLWPSLSVDFRTFFGLLRGL